MTMKDLTARLETKWLLWRVVIPLLGPIFISLLVILAWTSGRPDFKPSLGIVVDVSPWALTFYALTLIGSTLNELWPKLGKSPDSWNRARGRGLRRRAVCRFYGDMATRSELRSGPTSLRSRASAPTDGGHPVSYWL